jgi:hypothetical protein
MDCIGLFCEDIREELSGSHSIIGVMPDNINIQGPGIREPGGQLIFPKMGFYVRANFETRQTAPRRIATEVRIPGREVMKLGVLGPETIEKAFADSATNNQPFVGVIFKSVVAPISISQSGIATLQIIVDGQEQICGTLNIRIIGQSDISNA